MSDSVTTIHRQPVRLRMRSDLVIERQSHQGESRWVAKDPLSLRYYRLRREQIIVLELLDGVRSIEEIEVALREQLPNTKITAHRIQLLLGMLHQCGLVVADAPGQGEQLLQRHRTQRLAKLYSFFLGILWLRLPGIDPDQFLTRLHSRLRFLFHPMTVLLWLTFGAAALLVVGVHFDEFTAKLPRFQQFFAGSNLFLLAVSLAIVKVMHELGHGLACKHFGGECHQMGVMFLVFTPCLYCDTTDTWMVGNRWHRAMIGAAGMYVELLIASLCTFIWWYTNPGVIHYLCLNMMFVCSVSTLVFNINPLLRFDGYYILSDLMEVPNLGQKSRAALTGLLRNVCLGLPWNKELPMPKRQRWLFAFYAVASVVYRWFVAIVILWFLSKVFEPFGLEPIAHVLIALSLIGMIGVPLWSVYRYFSVPGRYRLVKKKRLLITVSIIAVLAGAVCLIPIPQHVIAPVVIQPHDARRVYISVEGELQKIEVEPGKPVKANDRLATLFNPDVDSEIIRLTGQQRRLKQRLVSLKRQEGLVPGTSATIPHTQAILDSVTSQLQHLNEDKLELSLIAGRDGVVLSPPSMNSTRQTPGELSGWTESPLDQRNVGAWFEKGTLFCLIGDPKNMAAHLIVDQTDVDYVREGQPVEVLIDGYPNETWNGKLAEIANSKLVAAPTEASNLTGGILQTWTDESGHLRPENTSYEAIVSINNASGQLISGSRGIAKIQIDSRPLANTIWLWLLETFRFG